MGFILILFVLVIISIGIAYYFDYKNDKKGFKKSMKNIGFLILIILGLCVISSIIEKLWNYIFK